MRYIFIGPKLLYYLSLVSSFLGLVVLTFLFYKSVYSPYIELMIFFAVLITVVIGLIFFCVNKFIYATIDTEKGALIFGNILFKQECPMTLVKHVGKFLFYKSIVKIRIENRTFYYASDRLGTEDYFK
jgi:hypothetical protein